MNGQFERMATKKNSSKICSMKKMLQLKSLSQIIAFLFIFPCYFNIITCLRALLKPLRLKVQIFSAALQSGFFWFL